MNTWPDLHKLKLCFTLVLLELDTAALANNSGAL